MPDGTPKKKRKPSRSLPSELKLHDGERAFGNLGFIRERQKGSHVIFKREDGSRGTVVLTAVTYRSILSRILTANGISRDDFLQALKK